MVQWNRGKPVPVTGAMRFVVWFHAEPAALLMSSFLVVCSNRLRDFVSLRVPDADRCRPSISKKSLMISPPFSENFPNGQWRHSLYHRRWVSLMSDPFETAEESSVLGQMPLITTCPEADFFLCLINDISDIVRICTTVGTFKRVQNITTFCPTYRLYVDVAVFIGNIIPDGRVAVL